MDKIGEREREGYRLWLRGEQGRIELDGEPALIDAVERLAALGFPAPSAPAIAQEVPRAATGTAHDAPAGSGAV